MTLATATSRLVSSLDPRRAHEVCEQLLSSAGVTVGGSAPWDMRVHDERLWPRILRDGTLGVGEAYVDGWWDAPAPDQFFERVLRARLGDAMRETWMLVPHVVRARVLNLQSLRRATGNGRHHYDLGNDLYEAMLDRRMLYTCALWNGDGTGDDDLEAAQERKLAHVCTKLGLRPGMRVLDLGCGWGGFAAYAAEHHGVHVTGFTVSEEQVRWAHQHHGHLAVDVRLGDYRQAAGTFDAVVSIGLMEHVGPKNYRAYMELVDRCLAARGVALIHTIGGNRARTQLEPWFDRYIFPGGVLPTLSQLVTAMEGLFIPEDIDNIGADYDPTLMAWWRRFDAAWPRLQARYDPRFYRIWSYYLLASAGAFRARGQQLFQIVMTRPGTPPPPGRRGLPRSPA